MSSGTELQGTVHVPFTPEGLDQFANNQSQINGQLCRAIWQLVFAFSKANPTLDLTQLETDVKKIADIFPPGCLPRDPTL